jgi:hypothetical protein
LFVNLQRSFQFYKKTDSNGALSGTSAETSAKTFTTANTADEVIAGAHRFA